MDNEINKKLEPHLQPGESILWCGRPKPKFVFKKSSIVPLLFFLFWFSFVAFLTIQAWQLNSLFYFRIPGLLIFSLTLHLVFGRSVRTSYIRTRTCYALTNLRVLALEKNLLSAQAIKDITKEKVLLHKGDNGSIFFGDYLSYHYSTLRNQQARDRAIAFQFIDDCPQVFVEYQNLKLRMNDEA